MKNFKRAAAILGVVVLLAVCCLPMIFAFGSGDNAQGNFKAAVGSVILVPVLAYVFLMVYKLLKQCLYNSQHFLKPYYKFQIDLFHNLHNHMYYLCSYFEQTSYLPLMHLD